MRTQLCTTVPPITKRQADELIASHYGTLTALLTVLIDRAYQEEMDASDADRLDAAHSAHCARCGREIKPGDIWNKGTYGEVYCQGCSNEA
jgi:hypothetical protein